MKINRNYFVVYNVDSFVLSYIELENTNLLYRRNESTCMT